jgi:hypothetical protein
MEISFYGAFYNNNIVIIISREEEGREGFCE